MPDRSVSLRSALHVISGLRADVLALRSQFGLHRQETDPKRRETWEISASKTYVLGLAREALESLPSVPVSAEFENLLFQKLNSSLFRELLVSRLARLREMHSDANGLFDEALPSKFSFAAEHVAELLKAFDDLGNAGVQPKDKENEPPPMGNPPVTAAAQPRLSDLFEMMPARNQRITVYDLTRISEWCLDRLDELAPPVRWSAKAGAVGEGDMDSDS